MFPQKVRAKNAKFIYNNSNSSLLKYIYNTLYIYIYQLRPMPAPPWLEFLQPPNVYVYIYIYQTYSCPRGWRVLASWRLILEALWTSQQYCTEGFKVRPWIGPLLCRVRHLLTWNQIWIVFKGFMGGLQTGLRKYLSLRARHSDVVRVFLNICCPRDCVSRHNGGTSAAPLKPLRVDSALKALSTLTNRH